MTNRKSSYRLFEAIVNLSKSDDWEEARKEWYLAYIEVADNKEVAENEFECLCGHPHLKELCYIKNKINGAEVLVGNCCVKKFMKLGSDQIFQAIRRGKVNQAAIEYAFEHNIISEWEHEFLSDVWRKRNLSPKQKAIFDKLQARILRMAKK
jgi:hypothetical protein